MAASRFACDESQTIIYDLPLENAVEVSAVNVFGLQPEQILRIRRLINPIHIIHMQDYIQIIIPRQQYDTTIRLVHAVLIEEQ